jgi:hypothetical protein
MSYILYYSKRDAFCTKMLEYLSKVSIDPSVQMHYVCIDKRTKQDDKIYVELDNGEKLILPHTIKSVPSLMIVSDNFKVISGDTIYSVLQSISSDAPPSQNQNQPRQNNQIQTPPPGGNNSSMNSNMGGGSDKLEFFSTSSSSMGYGSFGSANDGGNNNNDGGGSWMDAYKNSNLTT